MSVLLSKEKTALGTVYRLPSVTSYLDKLIKKEMTVTEYISYCLNNYDTFENKVQAWTCFDRDNLWKQAIELDQSIDENLNAIDQSFKNKLYGVPIGIKDIFNTADMKTEYGSALFLGYTPGNDARVVTSIRRSNGIIMGKTVTAELCVHTPGMTRNPLDLMRTPGTSSSGSAAAIASGMVPLALSSQTAGSTIRPSSYCGIIGYKPSFGVLPRTAMLKTTDTLDTVSIMGAYLLDILLLFNVLRVRGQNYPIVNQQLVPRPKAGHRWRVGMVQGSYSDYQDPTINIQLSKIADVLSDIGCEITWLDLSKQFKNSDKVHRTLYYRSLAYYFKREWAAHPELFSKGLSDIINEGNGIPIRDYHKCCAAQIEIRSEFQKLFNQLDILMCPSAATEAPIETDESIPLDYNHLVTLCHSPTISLPLMQGQSRLPIGVQCIAKKYYDYQLFDFCCYIMNIMDSNAIS